MPDHYYAAAYWGARKEHSAQCASRLANCLIELRGVSDLYSKWYRKARLKEEALENGIKVEQDVLEQLLIEGRNRKDTTGEVINELGFNVGLWNGGKDEQKSVGLSATCGAYSNYVENSIVLNLPPAKEESWAMNFEEAKRTIVALIETWEPERAVVTSHEYQGEAEPGSCTRSVGWMYYSNNLESPAGNYPFEVLRVDDGLLLVTTRNVFSSNDPQHLELAREAEKFLKGGHVQSSE